MNRRIFKDKKLVIASHNKGKIIEIKDLLTPLNIDILSAYDFNIEEPEENGATRACGDPAAGGVAAAEHVGSAQRLRGAGIEAPHVRGHRRRSRGSP